MPNDVHCFRCGRFKSCPAAACTSCGDQPLPHNSDAYSFDREYAHYRDTHDHTAYDYSRR